MFQKKIFILIFLSLLIISCGGGGGGTSEQALGINAATPSPTPVPTSPQNSSFITSNLIAHTAGTIQGEINYSEINREFILYVPSSYNSSTKQALVFNFHGYGGTATNHMLTADFRPIADTAGFILVYPQGLLSEEGSPHWNITEGGGDNKSDSDDFGFIGSLINELSFEYKNVLFISSVSNFSTFSDVLSLSLSLVPFSRSLISN